jgi:hypothetical protein
VKFAVFFLILGGGVPAIASLAISSERWRALVVSTLVFSPVLGDLGSINFLSLEHYRGPDRGYEVTLTDILALGLGLALVLKQSSRLRFFPYNSAFMLLLFLVGVASTAQGAVPLLGTFTLFKAVRLYVSFWVLANALRTGVPLDAVRRGLAAAGLLMTASCLQQKYLFGMYRVHGTFDHSNGIPLYANLAIPPLLVWAVGDRGLARRDALLTLVAGLGLVFAVVATQSRAGLMLSGGVVTGALAVAARKVPSRRVTKTAVLVLGVTLVGGAMAADTIIRRFQEAPESSEAAREEFNEAARRMSQDRWLGVGLNNFSRVLKEVPRYSEVIEVMKGEEEGGVAHHIYWLTAAEMGFPALVVFVAILARFAWLALRLGWARRDLEGALALAFLLGFAALHAQGTLEWGLRITPITFQFALCAATVVGIFEASSLRPKDGAAPIAPPPGQSAPPRGRRARLAAEAEGCKRLTPHEITPRPRGRGLAPVLELPPA